MTEDANTDLGWPTLAFLIAIVMFGVVLVGQAPKWLIYVLVFAWWGFVLLRSFINPTTANAEKTVLDEYK